MKIASIKKCVKNHAGFTLIELMIVSVVALVFLLALASVMIVGYRNWQINRAAITLNDNLVNGLRAMVRELREAGVASPNGIQIFGPGSSGLTFELPTAVGPEGPTAWQTISYALGGSDGKQVLRTLGGNVRVLATDISHLSFTYNALTNPQEVGIDITGTKQAVNGTLLTQAMSMEVTVRN